MSLMKMALLSTCVALALTGCGGGEVKEKVDNAVTHVKADINKTEDKINNALHETKDLINSAELTHDEVKFIESFPAPRISGTPTALQAFSTIKNALDNPDYPAIIEDYGSGKNLIIEIPGKDTTKAIVVGAHYDTQAHNEPGNDGDDGITDNAAAVATLVTLAREFEKSKPDHTLRIVFFDSGEDGQKGSSYYVKHMKEDAVILGMINLDAFVGGDHLYLETPSSTLSNCQNYFDGAELKDKILNTIKENRIKTLGYDYKPDTIDSQNDMTAFTCNGIPSVTIESTNKEIQGQSDKFDGISQTTNKAFWSDGFDNSTKSASTPQAEQFWGVIRHTGNDNLRRLKPTHIWEPVITTQLIVHNSVLYHFLKHPGL